MGNVMRGVRTCNNLDSGHCGSPAEDSEEDTAVVLGDYPPPDVSEPIFRMGEKLGIVAQEGYWRKARSLQTGKENFIPGIHVARVYHGWLFEGVTRQKAEELLLLPGNRVGSFLVRESSAERGMYVLSVKHGIIRHYRISRLDNSWYYISPGLTFQCLEDLVNYYSDFAGGLCCALTSPCQSSRTAPPTDDPPVVARRRLDWKERDGTRPPGDGVLSYGIRNSVSAYLSFSECEEARSRRAQSRREKGKSLYGLPEKSPANIDYGAL
ncbi:src like adaptor 1a isoform X2 [Phyllopteryx taeniolatus]|uniref:src like adaptor 1a isoform X2 n=2 Tax=Phyllopteryx taeniolatus TaxID=161469 RepID=UPI002AD4B5EB|nr:src like adaptor 1a isoform X2 [Phyllopteryx taeniolatus]